MPRRAISFVAPLCYLAILVLLTLHVARSPAWNLDGVFYSVRIAQADLPIARAHALIYEEIDQIAPASEARALKAGSSYRKRMRTDVDLFELQLPFYDVKPLYVWAGRLLHILKVSALEAPYAVSSLCYLLIGLCVPIWAVLLEVSLGVSLLGSLALMASIPVRDVCELATPDALCALCLVLALMFARRLPWAMLACLALSILARPDSVVFAVSVVGVRLAFVSASRGPLLAALITLPIFALATSRLAHGYGWSTVMRHTFIKALSDAEQLEAPFGARDYARALWKGIRGHATLHIANFLPFLAPAVVSVYAWGRAQRVDPWRESALELMAIWLGALLHFMIFPVLGDRFFLPAYLATVPLALSLLSHRYAFARSGRGDR